MSRFGISDSGVGHKTLSSKLPWAEQGDTGVNGVV